MTSRDTGITVSKETQKILAKKLSSDQIFVLLIFLISAVMVYFMVGRIMSQMDEVNIRLDKIIDLNERSLYTIQDYLNLNKQKVMTP